jgi:hypothetical protein
LPPTLLDQPCVYCGVTLDIDNLSLDHIPAGQPRRQLLSHKHARLLQALQSNQGDDGRAGIRGTASAHPEVAGTSGE